MSSRSPVALALLIAAVPGLAGCAAEDSAPIETADAPPVAEAPPRHAGDAHAVDDYEGANLRAATTQSGGHGIFAVGSRSGVTEYDLRPIDRIVLNATWTSMNPVESRLEIVLHGLDSGRRVAATGSSPVTLILPIDADDAGTYRAGFRLVGDPAASARDEVAFHARVERAPGVA